MSCQLSFADQMQKILDEQKDTCPDAIRWIMNQLSHYDISNIKTEYDEFVEMLSGTNPFAGNPYNPEKRNKIELIKWYRDKHGSSLKEAKSACDKYVFVNYYN